MPSLSANPAPNGGVEGFLSFNHTLDLDDKRYIVRRVVRLSDGRSVAAYKIEFSSRMTQQPCTVFPADDALFSSFNFSVDGEDHPFTSQVNVAPDAEGEGYRLSWLAPLRPWSEFDRYCVPFVVNINGGAAFYACFRLFGTLEPGSTRLTELQTEGIIGWNVAASYDDLFVWAEAPPEDLMSTRIGAWTPSAGVHSLGPSVRGRVCRLALGPTRLAGTMSDLPLQGCWEDIPDQIRFWHLGRAEGNAGVLKSSPPIEHRVFQQRMAVGDSYLAMGVFYFSDDPLKDNQEFILLARLSDWKIRWLKASPGNRFRDYAIAIVGDSLYFTEGPKNWGAAVARTLYRYDLASRFDTLGTEEPFPVSP
ncbi:MAG TPA: hypothetical protein VGD74_08500 [Vulgatibacter sp.]